jgi:LPXTG-motif cell wall-anchored protein
MVSLLYSKGNNHEKDQSELPETGQDGVNKGTLFGTLLAGLGALFLFFKRRREDVHDYYLCLLMMSHGFFVVQHHLKLHYFQIHDLVLLDKMV